jgi:hypothetical protein
MKQHIFLIVSMVLLPNVLHAQTTELEESIFIVAQENRMALPPEACDWALVFLGGQPLISAAHSDLYSVKVKNDGSVVRSKTPVGELVGCTADFTLEYERVIFPTADLGEVWQMTLHGTDYTVGGSNRFRTDPFSYPYGFPVPNTGMWLGTGTGTIHKSFETDWPPVVVGSFSTNYVFSESSTVGFNPDLSSIITIRLYE